jgi:hypothetical protein
VRVRVGVARKGEEGQGFLRKGRNDIGVVDDQQESDTLRNYSIPKADVGWSCRGGGKCMRIHGRTNTLQKHDIK